MQQRMTWTEICKTEEFRGRWVALCECSYDDATEKVTEGDVVDVDDNLADLCQRVRNSDLKNCEILRCIDA